MRRAITGMKGSRRHMAGLSLIELMVALVLGLLVVAAAIGIFLSNRQAYRTTESVGRVQESTRMAFELMARDVREAGGNACNASGESGSIAGTPLVNVLANPAANWWSNWGNVPGTGRLNGALVGYGTGNAVPGLTTGTGNAQRMAGTEALVVLSGGSRVAVVDAHAPGSHAFTVMDAGHGFQTGDVLLVCGQDNTGITTPADATGRVITSSAIFRMTNGGGSTVIQHEAGGGNATGELGPCLPSCPATFGQHASISRVRAAVWYIGNGTDGPALYQAMLGGGGNVTNQEIIPGVTGMALQYLLRGAANYVDVGAVPADGWGNVVAVRMTLQLESSGPDGNTGTDGNPIRRQLVQVANLRNRSL